MKLIVREPFGGYSKGDEITEPAAVRALLESHPHHVIRQAKPKVETGDGKSGTN